MKIIVEGPNGSGKSTLIERLSKDLRFPVIHGGGAPRTTFEAIHRLSKEVRRKGPLIMDRQLCFSEWVYGEIFQRGLIDRPSMEKGWGYEDIIIFCKSGENLMGDGHIHRDETYSKTIRDNLSQVNSEYVKLFNALMGNPKTKDKVFLYNWRYNRGYNNLLNFIEEKKRIKNERNFIDPFSRDSEESEQIRRED